MHRSLQIRYAHAAWAATGCLILQWGEPRRCVHGSLQGAVMLRHDMLGFSPRTNDVFLKTQIRHRIRAHRLPLDVLRKTQIPGRQCPDPRTKAHFGVGNSMLGMSWRVKRSSHEFRKVNSRFRHETCGDVLQVLQALGGLLGEV